MSKQPIQLEILSNIIHYFHCKTLNNNTLIGIISCSKVGKHKLESKLKTNIMYHNIIDSKPMVQCLDYRFNMKILGIHTLLWVL